MINEYNNSNYSEISSFKESGQVKELNQTAQESFSPLPNEPPKETSLETKKGQKKTATKKGKGVALANMLVATVVTVTATVGSGIVSPRKAEVDLLEIWAGTQEICYQIEVGETQSELIVTLENDFTHRKESLKTGENQGEFTNLAPNMEYTLSVKFADGLNETVEKRRVKTNGENPKPEIEQEPEKEPPSKPNVEFNYIPAKSADGQFIFTANVNSSLLATYSQIYVRIYENYVEGGVPTVEERIYYKDEDSGHVFEDSVGQQVQIDVKDIFYVSSGYVEVVAKKKVKGAEPSTDTSGTYESVTIYQRKIELYEKKTAIEKVTVTPSEDGSTLKITVDFVDENGIWNTSVSDAGETYVLAVRIYDADYVYDSLLGYIQTTGQTVEMVIPTDQYLDGLAEINISCYDENGYEIILYYQENVEIMV